MTNKEFNSQKGFIFSKHIPEDISNFDRVFDLFKDLLTHTSGDIEEAFEWLDMLDKEYNIFTDEYSLEDFEEDLRKRGYIRKEDSEEGNSGKGQGKNIDSKAGGRIERICTGSDFWKAEKKRYGKSSY